MRCTTYAWQPLFMPTGATHIFGILFFVFTARSETLDVVASDEGALEWHKVDTLPVDTMASDLPIILPTYSRSATQRPTGSWPIAMTNRTG